MSRWIALCAALAAVPATAKSPADIPIGDFWKQSEFVNIQISPDGKHFGAIVPDEETRALVIFQRGDRKVTGVARSIMADTSPVSSSTVSPFMRSATMNPAI